MHHTNLGVFSHEDKFSNLPHLSKPIHPRFLKWDRLGNDTEYADILKNGLPPWGGYLLCENP